MNKKISFVVSLAVALVSFQLTVSAQDAADGSQDDSPTAAVNWVRTVEPSMPSSQHTLRRQPDCLGGHSWNG